MGEVQKLGVCLLQFKGKRRRLDVVAGHSLKRSHRVNVINIQPAGESGCTVPKQLISTVQESIIHDVQN